MTNHPNRSPAAKLVNQLIEAAGAKGLSAGERQLLNSERMKLQSVISASAYDFCDRNDSPAEATEAKRAAIFNQAAEARRVARMYGIDA